MKKLCRKKMTKIMLRIMKIKNTN